MRRRRHAGRQIRRIRFGTKTAGAANSGLLDSQ
jgi:hypothetical protein